MHPNNINASIITIGDELLIGQVIDSNSAWMARELNGIGIWVRHRVAVGDIRDEIWKALDQELEGSPIVLITGGLGPTADDITKPLLCDYFGGQLIVDEMALANVKNIFERILKRPLTETNLKQAEVPDCCSVIQNKRGTAPGMWFEKDGKIVVSMPGVPNEMQGMMTSEVLGRLQKSFTLPFILHKTLLTAGIGESSLAEHILAFESALPAPFTLAYLPNYGMVRLRLTGRAEEKIKLENELQFQFNQLKQLVREWLVIDEDLSLQEAVGRLLKERNQTLSTAESCTGGYIAHLITTIPGSSQYFQGSIVSYSNKIKEGLLHVDPAIIRDFGAVSQETVRQMAQGALSALGTDYTIAVSGIMGPDGGTAEKPVGTVWIAVANHRQTLDQQFYFRFDRMRNIELTANTALNLIRKFIIAQSPL